MPSIWARAPTGNGCTSEILWLGCVPPSRRTPGKIRPTAIITATAEQRAVTAKVIRRVPDIRKVQPPIVLGIED